MSIEQMEERLARSKTFLARKEEIHAELRQSIIGLRHGIARQESEIFNYKQGDKDVDTTIGYKPN
jgi:hypothetical protein